MSAQARKRFGQHFLHERATIERIVAAVAPQPGDHLVEIGPGEGVLTRPLLEAVGRLDAVEIDRDLAAALRARDDWPGTLELHEADALAFDFAALARDRPLRLVGNLPYNISTPLLFHLLSQRTSITDMHFMLQREVVDRMASGPGNKVYGRLSVMIQAYCVVTPLFRIAPGAFRPPPAVESAVVRLVPRTPLVPPEHVDVFAEIVRLAFGARRKTLRNTLRSRLSAEAVSAAGVDPSARPESLPVSAFAALAAAAYAGRE
ncbi:MAG: 16S rRNA (adenine(1518)-N(6)/adenine(1519)-N(6))-dimethyltransferase RsmA [Halofilum sp. (in: g-proteobacteria)]